jgi:hypothetical protein
MRYRFHATRAIPELDVLPGDWVSLDSQYPQDLIIEKRVAANPDLFFSAFLDGSLIDDLIDRPPGQVEDLARLVAGLPAHPDLDRRQADRRGPRLMRP